jgi:hypothetical protein
MLALLLACTEQAVGAGGESDGESDEHGELGLPPCSEVVYGDVRIESAADMDAIANVVEIYGELTIADHEVVELEGANCLETIHGKLSIVGLGDLERVDEAFTRLRAIEPYAGTYQVSGLFVYGNHKLVSLAGLNALERVEDRVWLIQNAQLASLPFASLQRIGGDFELTGPSLPDLTDFAGVREIEGPLGIRDVPQMVDLDGLQGLELLGGLRLGPTLPNLTSLEGLELDTIGDLYLYDTPLLDLAGLESLTTITGNLTLVDNDELLSLTGLDNLVELLDGDYRENLVIVHNSALTSLAGLEALTAVTDHVLICDNDALVDFGGLASLSAATHVSVTYNASTNDSDALAFAAVLPAVEHVKVDGNGPLAPMWWEKPECPWTYDAVCDEEDDWEDGIRTSCEQDCCGLYGPTNLCAAGTDDGDCEGPPGP